MKSNYAVVTIEIGALKVEKAMTFEEVESIYLSRDVPLRNAFERALAEVNEVFHPPAGDN